MIKRYFNLLHKDLINAYRNYFFLVIIIVALIFVGIIKFVIPEDADIKPSVYYLMNYSGDKEQALWDVIRKSEKNHSNIYRVQSEDELIDKMKDNLNSVGMLIRKEDGRPQIEFIVQGYENEKAINLLIISMKDDINRRVLGDIEVDSEILNIDRDTESIPLNKRVLPLFILMEPAMMGFVMIAAFIFMEKSEGTIKSFLVSPGRISEYLASKITVMLILGIISTLLSTILILGLDIRFMELLLLVTVGSIFSSGLGLILGSFFDNISQAMIWIIIISLVISIPFISYFLPSFSPLYIKLIPTYLLMFGIREAIFPTGNPQIIYTTIITLGVLGIINYVIAIFAYKRNLIQ